MIANCGKDENGKYIGGKAGDQTDKEWEIREWYDRQWDCILRHPDPVVRELIAIYAERAAANPNIGYDQAQRLTYWQELQKNHYNPELISTPCEADCSSGVTADVKAVGVTLGLPDLVNIDVKSCTWDMKKNFQKAGFKVLTAKKYVKSQDELLRGDILLNEKSHVCTNLTNGKKIQNAVPVTAEDINAAAMAAREKYSQPSQAQQPPQKQAPKTTTYEVFGLKTYLNVRKAPTNGTIVGALHNGDRVSVISISNGWAKLDNGNYISAGYIKKV